MHKIIKKSISLLLIIVMLIAFTSPCLSADNLLGEDKELVIKIADKHDNLVREIGDNIWNYAELGLEEYKSAKYLTDKLEKMGFVVERGVAQFPTAFIGTYSYGKGGPVIGLLAEYDALPGVSYDNPGANGHGCGHNLYSAGALGTAAVLKEYLETKKIPATIKVFGTPAEETYDGKAWMGRQGALKEVDIFFGFHASDTNTIPYGSCLAMDFKRYTFYGKSSHAGAAPEKGISALDALEIMNVAVNYLREHVPMEVRMHYNITKGGEAPNIVPAVAQSQWFIRAPEKGIVDEVTAKVDNAARGAAMAAGCTVDIELVSALHNIIPNKAAVDLAWKNLQLVGAPRFDDNDQKAAKALGFEKGLSTELEAPPAEPSKSYGSSDEGDVSWNAPLVSIATANNAIGTAGHSIEDTKQNNMDAAYKAALQNIKVTACTVVDLLTKPEELKKIKDEFDETMKDKKYNPGDKVMLDFINFPEPPGVKAIAPNKISLKANETIFDEEIDTVINVYIGDKNIGSLTLKDLKDEYTIDTTTEFKAGDILSIKYKNKDKAEVIYGYMKEF